MQESIVKVENLSHRYSGQWAVKDINFELSQGGIYGLLGANGAGKSTIMNIMCGVLRQTSGEVFIKGVNIKSNAVEAKKHIGFLPQKPPLLMDLTVEEFLMHSADMRLMEASKVRMAVSEVMSKVGITHFSKRVIKNLSGGYQQRVGIAQAIIHKPAFVVMDEPTNGLDPNQILEVRNLIREIAEERTVVLSTHILQEVQALCNRIWMINRGDVVFSGTIAEFDNYMTPSAFVVRLLAPPPIEAIALLPGILKAERLDATNFRLQYDDKEETIERLIEVCGQNKWRLLEITLEKASMENVFAALSK